jgi:hypothetical protein
MRAAFEFEVSCLAVSGGGKDDQGEANSSNAHAISGESMVEVRHGTQG